MAGRLLFANVFEEKKQKNYKERLQSMKAMTDREVISRYRFKRETLEYIVNLLKDDISHPSGRSMALEAETQVLLALRFYASGSFLEVIGDTMGVDKSTVSRSLDRVTNALISRKDQFICWPNQEEMKKIKSNFFSNYQFPGIIGCIDGTHIPIQAPSVDEPAYVNRKGWHSINVQAVCDDMGRFLNIDARWPGSSHDAHIFRASDLCLHLETTHRQLRGGFLLGDSGYPCRPFLLTPYLRPATPKQERYNNVHTRARCIIERVFGWWKRRFHCLHGEIRMKPEKVCRIIGACAVLHNIAINMRDDSIGETETDDNITDIETQNRVTEIYQGQDDGRSVRRYITDNYF